jgi:hypothetical protein
MLLKKATRKGVRRPAQTGEGWSDFWNGVNDVAGKVYDSVKWAKDNKLASRVLSAIPHPTAQACGARAGAACWCKRVAGRPATKKKYMTGGGRKRANNLATE